MESEAGEGIRQTIIVTDSSKLAEVKTRSSSGLWKLRRRVLKFPEIDSALFASS